MGPPWWEQGTAVQTKLSDLLSTEVIMSLTGAPVGAGEKICSCNKHYTSSIQVYLLMWCWSRKWLCCWCYYQIQLSHWPYNCYQHQRRKLCVCWRLRWLTQSLLMMLLCFQVGYTRADKRMKYYTSQVQIVLTSMTQLQKKRCYWAISSHSFVVLGHLNGSGIIKNEHNRIQNLHNAIELLWLLGSTGAPSAPNATTKTMYVSSSVSPDSVSSVLLVFPPLSLLLPTAVDW